MFKSQKIAIVMSTLLTNIFMISYVVFATELSLLAKVLISLAPIIGSAIGFSGIYVNQIKEGRGVQHETH